MTQQEFLEKVNREFRDGGIGNPQWDWESRILAAAIGGLLVSLFCMWGWMIWGAV